MHIFRHFGFIKALLCIAVMSPLHRNVLLVCIQCDQVLVVWFGRSDHHLVLRRSLSGTVGASHRKPSANGRRRELHLNRWALEGSEANWTQLVVPVMSSLALFMACKWPLKPASILRPFARAVTFSFKPFICLFFAVWALLLLYNIFES